METFVWVARLRSFSSAAERLHTTQAAVSNRIATLERDLGIRLFERDMRSVRLTAQGQEALPRAEEIVRLAVEFRGAIGDGACLRGTVNIGTVDTIVYAWLPRLIEAVNARYPSVSLDLTVDTSLNIARLIQEGALDIGILMGPVNGPDIRNEEVSCFDCVWMAATQMPVPDGRLALADIARFPILAYSKGSLPHRALARMLAVAGAGPGRVYNSNSIATMIRLLCDGVGVTALPKELVQDLIDAGRIRLLDVDATMPPLHFHTAFAERPGNPLPAVIASIAAEIAADYRQTH